MKLVRSHAPGPRLAPASRASRSLPPTPSERGLVPRPLKRPPRTCAGCRFNNGTDCEEGFYGVRLYRDRDGVFQVGVCIQRMDLCLPLDEFVRSELRTEILELRDAEFRDLAVKYGAETEVRD